MIYYTVRSMGVGPSITRSLPHGRGSELFAAAGLRGDGDDGAVGEGVEVGFALLEDGEALVEFGADGGGGGGVGVSGEDGIVFEGEGFGEVAKLGVGAGDSVYDLKIRGDNGQGA